MFDDFTTEKNIPTGDQRIDLNKLVDENFRFPGKFSVYFVGDESERILFVKFAAFENDGLLMYLFDFDGTIYNPAHILSMRRIGDV